VEYRYLKFFIAVAEKLSFTRAAVRLRVAQPHLSREIRRLEGELDVPHLARAGALRYRPHGGDHRDLQIARLAADSDCRAQDMKRIGDWASLSLLRSSCSPR
jgi:hypothetical protein